MPIVGVWEWWWTKKYKKMVQVAELTRKAFIGGDISTVMSPRTVIAWAQNSLIFEDIAFAFRWVFEQVWWARKVNCFWIFSALFRYRVTREHFVESCLRIRWKKKNLRNWRYQKSISETTRAISGNETLK